MADFKGPLFNATAKSETHTMCLAIEDGVGREAKALVLQRLGAVLKNPTGFYESQIEVDRFSDESVVTDQGVVYGPWLEGIGSRNKDTRFKGYQTFRRVSQMLAARAGHTANIVAQPYIRRLG